MSPECDILKGDSLVTVPQAQESNQKQEMAATDRTIFPRPDLDFDKP
jgi:hypothetical protein